MLETIPPILFSPVAGVVADYWDRRWVMIISDFGAGVCTFILALLLTIDRLEKWHIYLIIGLISIFIVG